MLKAVLYKIWSRPLILTVFLLICLAQPVSVLLHHQENMRQLCEYYNAWGGPMDDDWKQSIAAQYERLWPQPPKTAEDLQNASLEQQAVLTAWQYTEFTAMLDRFVLAQESAYGEAAKHAYVKLRAASEHGALIFGASPAGTTMANQYRIGWGFLLFMILLCVDLFSGEAEAGMVPMQAVSRQGRRRLFRTKLLACQCSAGIVWCALNLTYAGTLTVCYGWGNLKSVVQDFQFNACPYPWNTGIYLFVTLLTGLLAAQATALVIFLLARIGGSTRRTFALMGGIVTLPYLLAFMTNNQWLALWLPCLINNQWLWNSLWLLMLRGYGVPLYVLAGTELAAVCVLAAVMIYRFAVRAEYVESLERHDKRGIEDENRI